MAAPYLKCALKKERRRRAGLWLGGTRGSAALASEQEEAAPMG